MKNKKITLVELLVIMAIIAIIASLLLPALNMVREKAKSISCINHEKQWGQYGTMYAGDFNDFFWPSGYSRGTGTVGWNDWYGYPRQTYLPNADIVKYRHAGYINYCPARYNGAYSSALTYGYYSYLISYDLDLYKMCKVKNISSVFWIHCAAQKEISFGLRYVNSSRIGYIHGLSGSGVKGNVNVLLGDGHVASYRYGMISARCYEPEL